MKEPSPLIIGLSCVVGLWFTTCVSLVSAILVAPSSISLANAAALCIFSLAAFLLGRRLGVKTNSKSPRAWGIGAATWLIPWIGIISLAGTQALSEDLGGALWGVVLLSLVVCVLPLGLVWLGMRCSWRA